MKKMHFKRMKGMGWGLEKHYKGSFEVGNGWRMKLCKHWWCGEERLCNVDVFLSRLQERSAKKEDDGVIKMDSKKGIFSVKFLYSLLEPRRAISFPIEWDLAEEENSFVCSPVIRCNGQACDKTYKPIGSVLGLPQVLLCRIQFLKEVLLLPALNNGDEKVISGLACLMSEIGQAAPSLIVEASAEAHLLADALLSMCPKVPSYAVTALCLSVYAVLHFQVKTGRLQTPHCNSGFAMPLMGFTCVYL
ncbi:hypothetical protein CK203_067447 [Vitis vinifera]|uniref:Uncharacterized protein n=1 Tax=Vitis vinifera TaxID=29760 RepID=A0A438EBJ8_VITVI|nr:hypothetical protein CK203_067447 [Vitis vinifera]